jgi:hypothetical protein
MRPRDSHGTRRSYGEDLSVAAKRINDIFVTGSVD